MSGTEAGGSVFGESIRNWAIALIKDTPPIDELAICVPLDRKYAFYTVRQMLVYRKCTEIYNRIRKLGESP